MSAQKPVPTTAPAHSPVHSSSVYSMTGFARIEGKAAEDLGYTLTLKSVNHRFLDLNFRLPNGCDGLEMELRQRLKEKIRRGHLELTLNLARTSAGQATLDQAVLESYVSAVRRAAAELKVVCEPDLNALLRLPGVIAQEQRSGASLGEAADAALIAAVGSRLDELIAALNLMRVREGEAMREDLRQSLRRLLALVDEVARLREGAQQAYFERMEQRLSKILSSSFESARLSQEAAMLVERSSIDEELVRLRAHIEHFHALLDAGGEVGKKLDFLLQELNREANTLLSKTSGVAGNGTAITEAGLAMKSEIEKAREQIQNLE